MLRWKVMFFAPRELVPGVLERRMVLHISLGQAF